MLQLYKTLYTQLRNIMNSPIGSSKGSPYNSPCRTMLATNNKDPTLSPVFHTLFDAETVVLSPSSISNLTQRSEVPTTVLGEILDTTERTGSINGGDNGRTTHAKPIQWFAIKRSIHGRTLITDSWTDCEPHVKVWNLTQTEKIIPHGVDFKQFDTFEQAVTFILA